MSAFTQPAPVVKREVWSGGTWVDRTNFDPAPFETFWRRLTYADGEQITVRPRNRTRNWAW